MPTLQEMLRLQNIFGAPQTGGNIPPTGPSSLTAPPVVSPGSDPYSNISFGPSTMGAPTPPSPDMTTQTSDDSTTDIGARMGQLYTPHTAAMDRMSQMIDQYPKREDYKPSVMRRIGAALTMFGRGGPNMAEQVMDKPFSEALTDWQNRMKPMETAAGIERYQNTNERMAAYQTVANELRQRAQDLKAKNDTENAAIREHRANIYEYKALHPGMKLAFPKGGNVMAIDSGTGETHDTGIPTGSMTELDKMNLQYEEQMKEIGARGAEQRKTEGVKEGFRQSDIAARGTQARETKRVVSGAGGKGEKPETPTQTRVRQFNAARELYNSRPELRPFIKLGTPSNNDFTISPPGESRIWGHTGPTSDQYQEIQNKIYGNKVAPTASHTAATAPTAPAGRVVIYDKTGKAVGTVLENQKDEAIRQGYMVK